MPNLTAFVTLLAVLFYFWTSLLVGRARAKYQIEAPATSGHPVFERTFRVQMNTLEWMPIFLPSLWLAAIYVSDIGAAVLGVVWIAGRVIYGRAYIEAAEKRSQGFAVQVLATAVLWLAAVIGVGASVLR